MPALDGSSWAGEAVDGAELVLLGAATVDAGELVGVDELVVGGLVTGGLVIVGGLVIGGLMAPPADGYFLPSAKLDEAGAWQRTAPASS